jgi:hypothetical protein
MVFIHMSNMDHEVKVLQKILNSELLLGKYPTIKKVWVSRNDWKIEIVLSVEEPPDDYWANRFEIKSYIHNLAKMVGVTEHLSIYP